MSAFATSAMRKATQAIRANARVLRYLASSLSSTAVDYTLLLVFNATIGGVFLPVALARVSSCTMNYTMNRKVFNARGGVVATAIRYADDSGFGLRRNGTVDGLADCKQFLVHRELPGAELLRLWHLG